jgi:hypothetical protein
VTAIDGFPAQSAVVDPVELRKDLAGLIIRTAAGVARQGIFPRTTTSIVTSLASMNVAVAAFEGIAVRGGGPVFLANDGSINVAIAAAPVSNSRIDVVYFRQKEDGYGGFADGSNGAEIAVVTGIAAASPVKPALPTGAVELATVLVPAGVATTNAGGVVITQTYAFTALTGSPIWVRNSTELAALTGFAAATKAYRLDNAVTYQYDGAAWAIELTYEHYQADTTPSIRGVITQRGIGKIAGAAAADVNEAVTFPVAFAGVPVVRADCIGFRATGAFNPAGLSAGQSLLGSSQAPSTTGFTAYVRQTTGGNLSAVQDYYYTWEATGVPA